jgi:hypothetical protein
MEIIKLWFVCMSNYDPSGVGDGHVSDSGWRVVDPEEWYADN